MFDWAIQWCFPQIFCLCSSYLTQYLFGFVTMLLYDSLELLLNSIVNRICSLLLVDLFRTMPITKKPCLLTLKTAPYLHRAETVTRRYSVKKGVLRNFAKFLGKHLCQNLFSDKIAGLPFLTEHLRACFPLWSLIKEWFYLIIFLEYED